MPEKEYFEREPTGLPGFSLIKDTGIMLTKGEDSFRFGIRGPLLPACGDSRKGLKGEKRFEDTGTKFNGGG